MNSCQKKVCGCKNRQVAYPLEIKRNSGNGRGLGLSIAWSDGTSSSLSNDCLRNNCPCATCLEDKSSKLNDVASESSKKSKPAGASRLKVVKASFEEELDLKEIFPVGQYAIGLLWGDGHNSGIYTYEYLRSLKG